MNKEAVLDLKTPFDWARTYSAAGLNVVPSYAPSLGKQYKRPALPEWQKYQKIRTTAEELQKWFSNQKYTDMGIICGHVSNNLLVIDIDAKGLMLEVCPGWRWWSDLLKRHNNGQPLSTWTEDTGGGGVHIFVRWPAAEGTAPSGALRAMGIDLQGQGKFIRVAPSEHASGKPYRFQRGFGPDEVALIEAPLWLVAAVRELLKHGGGIAASPSQGKPSTLLDAFRVDDGREELMVKITYKQACAARSHWDALRQGDATLAPRPSPDVIEQFFQRACEEYFRQVRPNDHHAEGCQLAAQDQLEREGRGRTALRDRFDRALRKNDGAVADAPKGQVVNGTRSNGTPSPFRLVPLNEIRPSLDGVWLVKGLMPRSGVGIIYGPSQSYKSFIMIDMLIAIAAKHEEWGRAKIKAPGAVVYVCAEGSGGIRNRISAARMKYGVPDNADLPFFLVEARPRLGVDQGDKAELIAAIRSQVPQDVKLACVVVDTLSQCLGGGEENGTGAQIFIGNMTDIATTFGCVACAVHHPGKGDEKRTRGHSSLDGNPDFQWLVENQGSLASRVSLTKMKDGDRALAIDVLLEVVELGIDEDGETVSTLVVEEIGKAIGGTAVPKSKTLTSSETYFFEIMGRVMLDHESRAARAQVKADVDGPPLDGVAEELVRERYLKELSDTKSPDTARKAYNRARTSLIHAHMLRHVEANGRSYLCDIRSRS